MSWQNINTAPKDGRNIIGFTVHGVEVVRWCKWNGREYAPRDGWIGVEVDSTCLPPNFRRVLTREKAQHQPTHWMPLPLPPVITEQSDMSYKNTIPKEFYKGDLDKPYAKDVGSLIELLKKLPPDLPIEQGFGRGVHLVVYNIRMRDTHLGFAESD